MSLTLDILTVATVDYSPQALATLRSAKRHTAHQSFNLFALDATRDSITRLRTLINEGSNWINVFGPHDLIFGRERFLSAFAYYNAFEMSCFAKYLGLAHIMRTPGAAQACVYCDADILFAGDVSEACIEIGDRAALLTPHQLGPASDRDELEHVFLGWLNAGFLAFRRDHAQAPQIIDWLVDRVGRRGFAAPHRGLFVDQIWVSALPLVFPSQIAVTQHPGLNVAYWNLDERQLTRSGQQILVNGKPLVFFHFSGFDPSNTRTLSKHADVGIAAGTLLDDLRNLYRSELENASEVASAARMMERIPSSRASLKSRMRAGCLANGTDNEFPSASDNLSSRLGRATKKFLTKPITAGRKPT